MAEQTLGRRGSRVKPARSLRAAAVVEAKHRGFTRLPRPVPSPAENEEYYAAREKKGYRCRNRTPRVSSWLRNEPLSWASRLYHRDRDLLVADGQAGYQDRREHHPHRK